MTELKIGGEAFDARIVNNDQIVHLYYDSEFEEKFKNHKGLKKALENHVRAQVDDTDGKVIKFHADDK